MVHAEVGFTAKSEKFNGKIEAPSNARSLEDMILELQKIAPEVFVE
jgi:hypothetical protein